MPVLSIPNNTNGNYETGSEKTGAEMAEQEAQ